jgi:hypothetical protein
MSAFPCYGTSSKFNGADSLRLEVSPDCFYLLPYHHLDLVKFESSQGGDILTLSFLNRTVRITGKNLRALAILFQRRDAEWVKPSPGRYASLDGDEPSVKAIEIEENKEIGHA